MRILPSALALWIAMAATMSATTTMIMVDAKKSSSSSRSRPTTTSSSSRRKSTASSSSARPGVSARPARRVREEEEEEEEFDFPAGEEYDVDAEEQEEDYEEEEEVVARPSSSSSRRGSRGPPPGRKPPAGRIAKQTSASRKKKSSRRPAYEDDYEYERPRSSSRRGAPPPGRRGGRVVPYSQPQPGAFSRGLSAIRDNLPDPGAVRDAATSTLSAARQTTTKLSSTLYREVKGLTSSELEQVMLKATRPDDSPVKGKHVERLVGVTYQISGRYDIYDAVLRKLWAKMTEKDWRTTIKALYVLHRFAADGAPEHAPALKARLRELRRTRDPKRKDKYFNSKQLLAGDSSPENIKFRAFMSRYAHYVLLRAQCFGGMFDEISHDPAAGGKSKKPAKPITSAALRTEHLEAATMLLKAGVACSLKEGEECENTALAAERVASDLIGLTTAVATALNRALKGNNLKGADPAIIKRWCEFYSEELLPQTRSMVKKTSAKLDAYGLFLPSRMGASVSPEILQKGLKAPELESSVAEEEGETKEEAATEAMDESTAESNSTPSETTKDVEREEEEPEKPREKAAEVDEYDAYDEYDIEEYYDDEEA